MNILVADLGGTSIKIGLMNEQRQIAHFKEVATESKKGGPYVVQNLITLIKSYSNYEAIGISTSGQVNHMDGSIVYANDNIPNYTGTPLKAILEAHFQVPVKVENDVNAAALGEKYMGAARIYKDFICLTYGTGVGGAIILNNSIYRGANGVAAEFGHFITHADEGLPCQCGNNGCYESYASSTALVKKAVAIHHEFNNGRKIIDEIQQGNVQLKTLLDEWVNEVALGIVSLVHIFNPPAVVIGGGIMEQEFVVEAVIEKFQKYVMNSFSNVEILKAELGNKAGLYGAASLFLLGTEDNS